VGRQAREEISCRSSIATEFATALRQIAQMTFILRDLGQPELRSFPSSWSKRLGYGRDSPAMLIEGYRQATTV
jgi:hypothetical protein